MERYFQSDPIGLAGGVNTFGYALGRPTGLIDAFGLSSVCAQKRAMVAKLRSVIQEERDFARVLISDFENQSGMTTYFEGFNGSGSLTEEMALQVIENKLTKALVTFGTSEISSNVEAGIMNSLKGALSPSAKIKTVGGLLKDAAPGFVRSELLHDVRVENLNANVSCSKGGALLLSNKWR